MASGEVRSYHASEVLRTRPDSPSTGVLAPLVSITIVRTVSFSIYQKAKYSYDDWIMRATGESPLLHANTPHAWPSLSTIACFGAAGATSGALITAISCTEAEINNGCGHG